MKPNYFAVVSSWSLLLVPAAVLAAQTDPPAQFVSTSSAAALGELPVVEVLASRIEHDPAGRAIGEVGRDQIGTREAFSLKDLMETTPGVSFKQSNGPRDVTISIRGSGDKTTYGINNILTYEDWFPTTQSDGLSRTDINDPNAYEGIDIIRGPSSALYGDYALGGVVNFRSRQGRDIDGVDVGSSYGSHNYWNDYIHAGGYSKELEYALFASGIGSDGYIQRSGFQTYTQNFTATYTPDDQRRVVFKFLNNDVRADVPSRLSLDQFNADPSQEGTTSVTGAGTVSADQAAQHRDDRRTIVGVRYEYQATPATALRLMGEYDVKAIDQVFGTITQEVNENFDQAADITHEGTLFDRDSRAYFGEFFNHMDEKNPTYFNLADDNGTTGALQSLAQGYQENAGVRAREEYDVTGRWTAIAGLGAESSTVDASVQSSTSAASPAYTRFNVSRRLYDVAPEMDAVFHAAPDVKLHARVAMGYGTPSISQLSTAANGLTGNNTTLNPQRNLGFELGGDGRALEEVEFNAAAYYEIFYDEFVTASPGAGLSSYTTNAPRADHRGVELAETWRPARDVYWSNSYTFNDAVYKTFDETIGPGDVVDRAGMKVPGIERQILNSRLGLETKDLAGGWIEGNWIPPYYLDNANTLQAPESVVFNLNVHYTRPMSGWFKKLTAYFEVHNLLDRKVVGSAVVVMDTPTSTPASMAANGQAFFEGEPLGFYGGVKLSF